MFQRQLLVAWAERFEMLLPTDDLVIKREEPDYLRLRIALTERLAVFRRRGTGPRRGTPL